MLEMPTATWKGHLAQAPQSMGARLSFMTPTHHRIRNFVVRELVYRGRPLEAEYIADRLDIPVEIVNTTLEELERNLVFVVRDDRGAVAWAYPVTAESTPHKLKFSSGERLYAA
jgi:hypothetical protein